MKRILVVLALLVVAGLAFAASASTTQAVNITIGTVVAIGIDPVGAIGLSTAAGVPGAPVTGTSDNSTYLRYTVAASAACRVTAQMDVAAPAGTSLTLLAAIGSGGGGGSQGTLPGGGLPVTLSNLAANNIITAIANCYTGTNAGDGANLTYTLVVSGSPASGTTPIVVTLTLTDT